MVSTQQMMSTEWLNDKKQIIYTGFALRVVMSIGVILIAAFMEKKGWVSAPPESVLCIALINILLNIPYIFLYLWLGYRDYIICLFTATDVVFIGLVSHYFGGVDCFYAGFAYVMIIFFCAHNLSNNITYIITILSIATYITVCGLESSSIIAHFPSVININNIPIEVKIGHLIFLSIVLISTCWCSVRISTKLENKTTGLMAAKRKIQNQNDTLKRTVSERTLELEHVNAMLKESFIKINEMKARKSIDVKMRSLGDFVEDAAHAIKSPILATNYILEDALKKIKKGQPIETDIEQAKVKCANLLKYVIELLALHGSATLRKKYVNINDMLKRCIEVYDDKYIAEKDINVHWNLAAINPNMRGNFQQLQHLFMNVIGNGLDAMETGGRLRLETINDNGSILIKISDNGIGINQAEMRHIFEPLYSTKTNGNGSGCGLPIAIKIVKRHGGKIKVKSTKGQGSSFSIELPTHTG